VFEATPNTFNNLLSQTPPSKNLPDHQQQPVLDIPEPPSIPPTPPPPPISISKTVKPEQCLSKTNEVALHSRTICTYVKPNKGAAPLEGELELLTSGFRHLIPSCRSRPPNSEFLQKTTYTTTLTEQSASVYSLLCPRCSSDFTVARPSYTRI
jgi:hypothetical protein